MSDRIFLDTNVLVYLYDRDSPQKQAKSRFLLERGSITADLVISTQVLQEFYVTVTRKFTRYISEEEIVLAMRGLGDLLTVPVNVPLIFDAIQLGRRYQISFWDALIIQAALFAGCNRLLTEDLQHGLSIGGLMVENPFLNN
jgi:predicted nucleic acid-binding protein